MLLSAKHVTLQPAYGPWKCLFLTEALSTVSVSHSEHYFTFILVTEYSVFAVLCVRLFTGGTRGWGAMTCQTPRRDAQDKKLHRLIQFLHRWTRETHFVVEMRDANEGSKIRNY
jgi:hypothetical protein